MSRSNAKKLGYLAAGAAILALLAAQGCSSDIDDQAKPTAGAAGAHSTAGAGGKASTTAGAGGKASTTAGKGGDDEVGGEAPSSEGGAGDVPSEAGAGGEGGAADCGGGDECYSCAPTTNDQLLNHCVPGGCPATFDNSTLTKLNLVGTL